MINYIEWAKEYEEKADELMRKVKELQGIKETQKLSSDVRHNLNQRIIRLTSLYREHRQVAKELRERGSGNG